MRIVNVLVACTTVNKQIKMPLQNGATDERAKLFSLNISIISAKLHGISGLFSKPPDVYVELIVDSVTSRKTAIRKKTNAPHWDEQIQFVLNTQIQVHESSILEFRLFGKSKLFEDSLIGQKILKMSHAIKKESDNGKFDNTKMTLQLSSPKDTARVGELKILLSGTVIRPKKKSVGEYI
ncbi:unnamed protein product [Onchocerca flexuosa]|uniref:C2 domain-containing protein n=1 Tax=Onchocerca flexuosa TaxID=387005 RepID=A0A183I372_9BILA|nr:unnamed protein product [Onchocerca flexuosa]